MASLARDEHSTAVTFSSLRSERGSRQFLVALVLFAAYLTVGTMFYSLGASNLSVEDALYFLIVSFTTVGYGDIIPENRTSDRTFTCFSILTGIVLLGYFASLSSDLIADKIQKRSRKHDLRLMGFITAVGRARSTAVEQAMEKTGLLSHFIKRLTRLIFGKQKKNAATIEETESFNTAPEKFREEIMSRNSSLIGSTLLGKAGATVDDVKQMSEIAFKYEIQPQKSNNRAIFSIASIVSLIILGAVIMGAIEHWSFLEAVYWALVTTTTVGFGDITPKSRGGRAFCILYILVGSIIMAQSIGVFIQYPLILRRRRMELKVMEQFQHLSVETLVNLTTAMQNRSNLIGVREPLVEAEEKKSSAAAAFPATSELRKAEFMIMLLEMMNKISPQDIVLAGRVFDSIDRDGDGCLSFLEIQAELQRATRRTTIVSAFGNEEAAPSARWSRQTTTDHIATEGIHDVTLTPLHQQL